MTLLDNRTRSGIGVSLIVGQSYLWVYKHSRLPKHALQARPVARYAVGVGLPGSRVTHLGCVAVVFGLDVGRPIFPPDFGSPNVVSHPLC